MSIKIMSWVWDNSPYEGKVLLIHLALADFANDEGTCWPNQKRIAKKCRCSVETVRTSVRKMQEDGLIEIVSASSGRGNSHVYHLLNPKLSGASSDGKAQVDDRNPQISSRKPPNPSPKNHQEPSITSSDTVSQKPKCPYCHRRYDPNKPHPCPAMNMLMR